MDTLDEARTGEVVRSYGAALYDLLLEMASLRRPPELYEAAAYPPAEAVAALPVLVDLTKLLGEHAADALGAHRLPRNLQVACEGALTAPPTGPWPGPSNGAGSTTSGTSD